MSKILRKFLIITLTTLFVFTACKTNSVANAALLESTPLQMDSAVKIGTLENGMTYYIKENHEPKNRIMLRLVVKAGSLMEDTDQKGVAHFVEHLAFNGTTNFPDTAISNYFESIGMAFGPELNAYTSFDKTVYEIEIPSDDQNALTTGLLVLHDWASQVTFSQEQIDRERGVILEEWRLYQGLEGRAQKTSFPFFFKDSPYVDADPIGDMDIIGSISRDRIVDFYKKWYRPEFMAVVIVGDTKSEKLEKLLKDTMNDIPSSTEKIEHPTFTIPERTEKDICIFTDPEQKTIGFGIYIQDPAYTPLNTTSQMRYRYALELVGSCLNQRFNELSKKPDTAWIGAEIYTSYFTSNDVFHFLEVQPKECQFEQAFKQLLTEYDRLINFGMDDVEFERNRKQFLKWADYNYLNKNKISSYNYVNALINVFLTGRVLTNEKDDYNYSKAIIKSITKEEALEIFKQAAGDRGKLLHIAAPDSARGEIPSKEKLMDIWQNYESSELTAYKEEQLSDNFMIHPTTKGKVASKKALKEIGGTEYTLSNGIKIITKKTDYEKDTIRMKISSIGGYDRLSDDDFYSSTISPSYAFNSGFKDLSYSQLMKIASTKNIAFNPYIVEIAEGVSAMATKKDLESIFQLTNLMFTQVNFNDESWAYIQNTLYENAKNHGANPSDVYIDKINSIIFQNNPRFAPFDLALLQKIDQKTAEKIYFDRFGNPADFTFIFVGDFDEKKLIDLCCSYLGTLKATSQKDEFYSRSYNLQKGPIQETIYKGLDSQGEVYLAFTGKMEPTTNMDELAIQESLIYKMIDILDIRLREIIREDKGGTYGVSLNFQNYGDNTDSSYIISIDFGCDPERQDELKNQVLQEIKNLQENGIDATYVDKVNEISRRNREVNLRNNEWLLKKIESAYAIKWISNDFMTNGELIPSLTTQQSMQEMLCKYINTEEYICVYLKPEK